MEKERENERHRVSGNATERKNLMMRETEREKQTCTYTE